MRELLRKTQELLNASFDMLPDPTPRGKHYEYCERLSGELAGMEFWKEDEYDKVSGEDELKTERSEVSLGPDDYLDTVRI